MNTDTNTDMPAAPTGTAQEMSMQLSCDRESLFLFTYPSAHPTSPLPLPLNPKTDSMAPTYTDPRRRRRLPRTLGPYEGGEFTKVEEVQERDHALTGSKRQVAEADTVVPGPPPAYTPSVALHASTVTAAPTALSSGVTPTTLAVPSGTSTTRPAVLPSTPLLAVLAAVVVGLLVLGGGGWWVVKRKAKRVGEKEGRLRFSMRGPVMVVTSKEGGGCECEKGGAGVDGKVMELGETEGAEKGAYGQFVYITHSDSHSECESESDCDEGFESRDRGAEESARRRSSCDLTILTSTATPQRKQETQTETGPIPRPLSAPSALCLANTLSGIPCTPVPIPPSLSAPATSGMDRLTSLCVQRRKAEELAQIALMRIVRVGGSGLGARGSGSRDYKQGLEEEEEVDIAGTALTALESYAVITPGSPTPHIPLTDLFKIDSAGRVVRMSAPPASSSSSPSSSSSSISERESESHADEEGRDELESAVIVRMAQTRSMEIKRGTLVSMATASHSAPTLLDALALPLPLPSTTPRTTGTGLSSPPPSLSPIIPCATSFTSDIEQSLEERVFGYRESGEWSRERYRLTTTGQVRALVEGLAVRRRVSVGREMERGWPWPAQRQG